MNRESGYYWIRFADEWGIAEYFDDSNDWLLIGSEESFSDEDFEEIGERVKRT